MLPHGEDRHMGEMSKDMMGLRRGHSLGRRLGQLKDVPMEMILPQGYGDIDKNKFIDKNIVTHQGWLCYVSRGRSRDMNVLENG